MSANKKGLAAFVKQQSEHALAGKILGLSAAKMRAGDFQHVKTEPAEDYRGRPAGVDIHYKLNGKDEVYGYANKKEAQHLERYSNRNIAESLGERNDPPMSGQNRPLPKGGKYTSAKTAADAAPSGRGTLAALGQKYRAAADRREQGKGAYDEGRSQATRYATEARKQGYTENEIDTHLQQHDKAAQRTVAAEGKIGESGSPTREPAEREHAPSRDPKDDYFDMRTAKWEKGKGKGDDSTGPVSRELRAAEKKGGGGKNPSERDMREHEDATLKQVIADGGDKDEIAELKQMMKDRRRDQPGRMLGTGGAGSKKQQDAAALRSSLERGGFTGEKKQGAVETGAKGGQFVRLPGGGKRYIKS